MKKLLSFLGSLSLIMVSAATVIACGEDQQTIAGKVDLAVHVPTQRVADFDHVNITNDEILDMAKQTNPDLNLDEVELTYNQWNQADENFIPNEAILTVKEGSTVYNSGSIMIYFTDPVHTRLGLVNILKQTDLGEMLTSVVDKRPSMEDVQKRLKELNPVLDLNNVQLSFNPATQEEIDLGGTISLELSNDHPYFIQPNEKYTLTYHKQTSLIDLDKVIQTTYLGIIDFYDSWDDVQMLRLIGSLNPYLEISQVKVTSKTRELIGHIRINVIDDSDKYNPSFVDFTFDSKINIDLESVLTNLDLGSFDDEPTDGQIFERLKTLNPLVDLNEIYISSNIKNKVIIREKFGSNKYWQTKIELSYQVKNLPYLQNIWSAIQTTNLGQLNVETNSKAIILAKVKELNPWLDLTNLGVEQLEVLQHRNGFATIKVIDNSRIYSPGSVEVSYINQNSISLKEVLKAAPIKNTVVGVNSLDDDDIEYETILKNLKYFNLNLDPTQIMIESINVRPVWGTDPVVAELYVNFKVKEDSNIYDINSNPVQLIFNLFKKVSLASLFTNTDLGTFKSIPTYRELSDRIFQVNSSVTRNSIIFLLQLHLRNDSNGHVEMKVVFPGFEVLTGSVNLTYTIDKG